MKEAPLVRDVLRSAWSRFRDRPAVVTTGRRLSFGELHDRVMRLANGLGSAGVRPGDVVGHVISSDVVSLVEIRLATYELGVTLFGIHPMLLQHQGGLIRAVDPKVILYDTNDVPGVAEWLRTEIPTAKAVAGGGDDSQYERLLQASPTSISDHVIDPDWLSALGFTSGTTGPPKGVTSTQRAVAWSCSRMRRLLSDADGSRPHGLLIGIPLFAAGSGAVVPALASGLSIHVPSRFDPEEMLGLIEAGEIKSAFLTPSMIIDLLDVEGLENRDLGGLESIVYGTSIMPVPKLEEAVERIGPVFMQGYAMAEVLPPVTLLTREEHGTGDDPADPLVLSSSGRPSAGVMLRVVDDQGIPLPAYGEGEVEVISPAVTTGYWGDEERTRHARHDGWWRTGDVGFLDEAGRLHILSRRADVLVVGDRQVYPRHIEEACSRHPAVKEACAVQHPSDQRIVAAVSLRTAERNGLSAERLRRELPEFLGRQLNGAMAIDSVLVLDEMPRSLQGKVLHREVRAAIAG